MAQIARLRVAWGGTPVVGPGLSTFYVTTTGPATLHGDVAAFFNSIKGNFPSGLQWTIPNTGDLIEDTTGALAGSWSESGGPSTVAATGTANYVAGAGMRVSWTTGGIFRGRRVKGSTFLCPMLNGLFTSDGTIDNTVVSTTQTAAAALLTAQPTLCIFSRPVDTTPGTHSVVTSALAVDKVSWLRSRRT